MVKQIYRYQSDVSFNEELSRFVKNNHDADRKDFKQAWIQWREEKDELFQIEIKKYIPFIIYIIYNRLSRKIICNSDTIEVCGGGWGHDLGYKGPLPC
ncbi:MAG: hypothetical protein NTY64_00365 [Deltaproteobacteria bacterium]|nr:hypothetical protein [Deltaproteobacteria bacterium]